MSLVEIYRVRVDPRKVGRLLEIHDQAIAEYQEQVHELDGIELVRLDDETWLDIIRWIAPVNPSGSRPQPTHRPRPRFARSWRRSWRTTADSLHVHRHPRIQHSGRPVMPNRSRRDTDRRHATLPVCRPCGHGRRASAPGGRGP